jgi:hypothetical protein
MTVLLTDEQARIMFVGTVPALYGPRDHERDAEFDAWLGAVKRDAQNEVADWIDGMVSVGFMNHRLARDIREHFALQSKN